MKRTIVLCCLTSLLCGMARGAAQSWTLQSPNAALKAEVYIEKEQVWFTLQHANPPQKGISAGGQPVKVLLPSRAGMSIKDGPTPGRGMRRVKTLQGKGRTERATPFYRKARIAEDYHWLTLRTAHWDMEFRAFNGGLAYRFVTRLKQDSIVVESETCDFHFAQDSGVCYLPLQDMATDFQGQYRQQSLQEIPSDQLMAPQCVVKLDGSRRALVTDFNVRDYPTMFLRHEKGHTLHGFFPNYPRREEIHGKNMTRLRVAEREDYIARTQASRAFPWRAVLVSANDGALLDSDVLACLADPCEMDDTSWIKPGKVAWEWWNGCNLTGVDFLTGINYDTYKYYIDFAARNGIEYILMDEGWSLRQQPLDLLVANPQVRLPELAQYAQQRGVGIILWADIVPFDRDMERVVSTYARMGIKGFKIDHINRNDQKAVAFVERATKVCARHHMVVDFHGVFPPTGLQFTWPNVLNYEAVLGLEVVKGKKEIDLVSHECIVPFARQAVGPIDYTQGAMRNANKDEYRDGGMKPMSQGTRCRQLAEYIVFESPLNMLCDSPTMYEANQPCTDFIGKVPVVWDETRVLAAKLGELIVIARRKGDIWYVGGLNGTWESRKISLPLNPTCQKSRAIQGSEVILYRDGLNTHKNAEDYRVERLPFSDTLRVRMAPGGGFAAIIQ